MKVILALNLLTYYSKMCNTFFIQNNQVCVGILRNYFPPLNILFLKIYARFYNKRLVFNVSYSSFFDTFMSTSYKQAFRKHYIFFLQLSNMSIHYLNCRTLHMAGPEAKFSNNIKYIANTIPVLPWPMRQCITRGCKRIKVQHFQWHDIFPNYKKCKIYILKGKCHAF